MKKLIHKLIVFLFVFGLLFQLQSVDGATVKLNYSKKTIYTGDTFVLKVKNTSKTSTIKSSNTKIATAKKKSKYQYTIKGIKKGTATFTVKVGSKSLKCKVTVKNKPVLNYTSLSVVEGKTSQTLNLKYVSGEKFYSKNKSIATISNNKVIGVKAGNTDVYTKYNGKEYKCKMTVKGVSINKTNLTLQVGESDVLDLLNITGEVWKSSNTDVAKVSGNKVIGVNPGTANIQTTYNKKTYTCKVIVKKKVTLNYTSLSIVEGKTSETLDLKNVDGEKFYSRNTGIAKVVDNKVVGVKAGTTEVYVKYDGIEHVCKVTVKGVSINKTSMTVKIGDTSDSLDLSNITGEVWKSSNPNVAKVSGDKVIGVSVGSANITSTYNNKTYTCKVTVPTPYLNYSTLTLIAGETSLKPINLINSVGEKFISKDTSIAKLSGKSIVAVKEGKTTVYTTVGGKTYSCSVTVKKASEADFIVSGSDSTALSINTTKSDITVNVGTTYFVSKYFSDVTSPKYYTSNESVCLTKLTSSYIMPVSTGTCKITAKGSNKNKTLTVTVNNPNNVKVGVDLSRHNGSLNMNVFKKKNISFAILRAGNGQLLGGSGSGTCKSTGEDKNFRTYVNDCKSAGLSYGAYWYLASNTSGVMTTAMAKKQGQALLKILKETNNTNIRIYLDLEDPTMYKGYSTSKTRGAYIAKLCQAFIKELTDGGIDESLISIYANKDWYENKLNNSYFLNFMHYWEARYEYAATQPSVTIAGVKVVPTIWQCGSEFRITGARGDNNAYVYDLNYLYN